MGLTQRDLADKIGAALTSLQRWELGYLPKGDHLIKLSEIFDCSIDTLLKEDAATALDAIKKSADNDRMGRIENLLTAIQDQIESRIGAIETRLRMKDLEAENARLRAMLEAGDYNAGERSAGGM